MAPVLERLAKEFSLKVLVICKQGASFSFHGLEYIRWKEETEIEDLLKINIGLMPLPSDSWSEGKCGFKLIQYLSLGIPAAASPVGVNKIIIGEENKQLLCTTEQEWREALVTLVKNPGMRKEVGKQGRERIIAAYSIQANAGLFVSLFE